MPRGVRTSLLLATAALAAAPALALAGSTAERAHDLALVNRLTWGATTSSAQDIEQIGAKRWLEAQLHPDRGDRLPQAAQAQIDALPISQTPMANLVVQMEAQQRAANQMADETQKADAKKAYQQAMGDLMKQAQTRSVLRDLYSQDQLKEQMTWFWLNHFNGHAQKRDVRAMIGDYEDQAIRPRALGRFRDLLEATLRHPAMLRYLDNDQNAGGKINENYAREIMELHTMGVGSGYSQQDVQELARILTGVGVNVRPEPPRIPPRYEGLYIRAGLFEFNPNRHDFGDKTFLGHTIRGRGYDEVREVLDILAREPATARHISTQMASYFMGDDVPPAVVDRMTRAWKDSDGDMAKVLGALFTSKEFDASLAKGVFKDPMHYAISAVRQAYDQRVIANTQPIQNWTNRMAEGLYGHETPDGYPMTAAAWSGPGQMAVRFEIARQIASGPAGLFKGEQQAEKPAFPQLQNALWYEGLDQSVSTPTKDALGQAVSPQDWNTLFLSSPEFMKR